MFKKKLAALKYPGNVNINVEDEKEFRSLVIYLEDQIIRYLKIEDRKGLREIESATWNDHFKKYLEKLGCSINEKDKNACTDWILGIAIRLAYEDNAKQYNSISLDQMKKKSVAPKIVSQNPLDNLDFESKEFKDGLAALANILKINSHPNHLVTLKAICLLVQQRFNCNQPFEKKEGSATSLSEVNLGFDMGDPIMNQAAKILRFLYLNDLRELQTKINEAIVVVQAVTANPKTDTRLGKVGY